MQIHDSLAANVPGLLMSVRLRVWRGVVGPGASLPHGEVKRGRVSVRRWRGVWGQTWDANSLRRESATAVWTAVAEGEEERGHDMGSGGQQTDGRLGRAGATGKSGTRAPHSPTCKDFAVEHKLQRTLIWGCYPQVNCWHRNGFDRAARQKITVHNAAQASVDVSKALSRRT